MSLQGSQKGEARSMRRGRQGMGAGDTGGARAECHPAGSNLSTISLTRAHWKCRLQGPLQTDRV